MTETYIPSESSVKAAKEKRERLRSGKASGEEEKTIEIIPHLNISAFEILNVANVPTFE